MIQKRYYALGLLWIGCIVGSIAVLPYALSVAQQPLQILSYSKVLQVLVQNAILYALIIFLGYLFAIKVGFHVFLFDRTERNFSHEMLTAVAAGTLLGCALLIFDISVFKSLFTSPYGSALTNLLYPFLASLYGAINEEALSRLFLLPLCTFIFMKALKTESPITLIYISILVTSVIFGILHLPSIAQLGPVNPFTILRVILLNTVAGIVFGWLFWKRGIESAIVAHFAADLVIHVLPRLMLIF